MIVIKVFYSVYHFVHFQVQNKVLILNSILPKKEES